MAHNLIGQNNNYQFFDNPENSLRATGVKAEVIIIKNLSLKKDGEQGTKEVIQVKDSADQKKDDNLESEEANEAIEIATEKISILLSRSIIDGNTAYEIFFFKNREYFNTSLDRFKLEQKVLGKAIIFDEFSLIAFEAITGEFLDRNSLSRDFIEKKGINPIYEEFNKAINSRKNSGIPVATIEFFEQKSEVDVYTLEKWKNNKWNKHKNLIRKMGEKSIDSDLEIVTLVHEDPQKYTVHKDHRDKYEIRYCVDDKEEKLYFKETFIIQEISITYGKGYIEKFIVTGYKPEYEGKRTVQFMNSYPIPISSQSNVDNFTNALLYNSYWSNRDRAKTLEFIRVNDFLSYHVIPTSAGTKNLSPKVNSKIILTPTIRYGMARKEPVTELLKARIFSDPVGIVGGNPNGLIQTEIERGFLINQRQKRNLTSTRGRKFGAFEDLKWRFTFAKLDQKDRGLNLSGETDTTGNYVTNVVELRRYRALENSFNLNMINLIFRDSKIAFRANLYVNSFITPIVDDSDTATLKTFDVASHEIRPELRVHFIDDDRSQLEVFGGYGLIWSPNQELTLRKGGTKNETTNNDFYVQFGADGNISIDESRTKKVFGRIEYNFLPNEPETNFFSLRVGYNISIMGKLNKLANPPSEDSEQ